jgi:hypothetical protein
LADKFQPGSIKGSIFTLMSATIGSGKLLCFIQLHITSFFAGVLSLPSAVNNSGLILGVGLIIFGGLLGYYSTFLLVSFLFDYIFLSLIKFL